MRDASRWQLQTGDEICIAVNVSLRQIMQNNFADSVLACLEEQGFPANRLEIELVERSLLAGKPEVTIQMERLDQAGIRISLDDFGTGQSSLSILHKLPIDTIKLDRTFILAMDDQRKSFPSSRQLSSWQTRWGSGLWQKALNTLVQYRLYCAWQTWTSTDIC